MYLFHSFRARWEGSIYQLILLILLPYYTTFVIISSVYHFILPSFPDLKLYVYILHTSSIYPHSFNLGRCLFWTKKKEKQCPDNFLKSKTANFCFAQLFRIVLRQHWGSDQWHSHHVPAGVLPDPGPGPLVVPVHGSALARWSHEQTGDLCSRWLKAIYKHLHTLALKPNSKCLQFYFEGSTTPWSGSRNALCSDMSTSPISTPWKESLPGQPKGFPRGIGLWNAVSSTFVCMHQWA